MAFDDDAIVAIEPWDGSPEFIVHGQGAGNRNVWLAEGGDGTEFDGMYDPPVTVLLTSTAFQTGATVTGTREEPYDFILAFHITGTEELPWRYADSDFRLAFDFLEQSRIRVEVEESTRWLSVQLGSKPKLQIGRDPNGQQYGLILVPLIAEYPRWVELDWGENTPPDHPTKFVTTTDTTASGFEDGFVTVWNPTPLKQWVRYSVQGAAGIIWTISDFSWGQEAMHDRDPGVDVARKITLAPLVAGEHLKIDTNPEAIDGMYNSNIDTQVYMRQQVEFMYPIPPRTPPTQVPIRVSKAPIGAGIQVRGPLHWNRPWGLQAVSGS